MKAKLTKSLIDDLKLSTDGKQETVMDTVTPGFGIRVGSQSKVFIVMKRIPHSTPKRVTLGKYGALTLEAARKMAQDTLASLSHGVDPNEEKRAVKLEQLAVIEEQEREESNDKQTLQWLFDEYRQIQLINNNGGSEGTLSSMDDCYKMFGPRQCQTLHYNPRTKKWENDEIINLPSFLTRPLRSITSQEILDRFEVMEVTRPQKLFGGVLAPMIRTHQVAYKFAQGAFAWFIPRNYHQTKKTEMLENPFHVLKVFNKWKPVNKRTRIVDFQDLEEFGTWWEAIEQYRSVAEVPADYIQYSILQGGRSIEIVNMKWDMIDMKKREITYEKTKNGDDYVIPLSKLAYEILERRLKNNPKSCKWVWYYPESETGHIPKDSKHHFNKLTEYGGKYVSTHDLKRTWASAASLVSKNERDTDYLLKHVRSDVGEHYYMKNKEVLLGILQGVEDKFLKLHRDYVMKINTPETVAA
ncbi:tyrosine-type recombinase/integrase [Variovorax sp. RB3P1]|uniref:tyrosine-type recombinase/integrase n=1 Tax=Variovorax sp. RB3P1 TaxID=3443732 RepID=UPI003F48C8ED